MKSAGAVELSRKHDVFEKAALVKAALQEISIEHSVTRVFIEENLQAFRPGFSSAKTIVTLARFNGIVTYLCNQVFEVRPEFLNVNSARKLVGLKINRKSDVSTKDQVLQFCEQKIPNFSWPTRKLKSGPRKGHVIPAETCYDIADAYVIATAGFCDE